MEHVDRPREELAIEVAASALGGNEVAGTVDDALVKLGMVKDGGAEEADGYLAERLMTRQQVRAVEVAEDPIEVFLAVSSQQSAPWPGHGRAHHLAVPLSPDLQRRAEHVDVGPAHARLDTRLEAAGDVGVAPCDQTVLHFTGHVLAADVLDAAVQLLEAEVNVALAEDGIERAVRLGPRLVEEDAGVDLAYRPEVLDQQPLRTRCGVCRGRRLAQAVTLPAGCGRAAVGPVRASRPLAGEAVHIGGAHGGGRGGCGSGGGRGCAAGALACRGPGRGGVRLGLGGEELFNGLFRVLAFQRTGMGGHWAVGELPGRRAMQHSNAASPPCRLVAVRHDALGRPLGIVQSRRMHHGRHRDAADRCASGPIRRPLHLLAGFPFRRLSRTTS